MKFNVKELSLEEKIGQMIIVGLNNSNAIDNLQEIIQKYKVGGVLLYKKNYKNYEEMVNLINKIKELNKVNKIPMFIVIDQEGGRVNRMPNEFKNLPSANKLASKSHEKNFVKIAGEITGRMLKKAGINMDLAPVLDLKRFKDNHSIGDRAFSKNQEEVSKYGVEYMKALQQNDIISIAKHFPGHGATDQDSHFIIPKLKYDVETLENEDIIPFKEAIKNKVDGILIGHLRVNEIDKNKPLTISKKFIVEYIRKKYRYNGLVVTDDMRMKATKVRYGKNKIVEKAFLAYNDIIIFKYDKDIKVIDNILQLVNKQKISLKRVNKSVMRILKAKKKYNLNDNKINADKDFIEEINNDIEKVRKEVL